MLTGKNLKRAFLFASPARATWQNGKQKLMDVQLTEHVDPPVVAPLPPGNGQGMCALEQREIRHSCRELFMWLGISLVKASHSEQGLSLEEDQPTWVEKEPGVREAQSSRPNKTCKRRSQPDRKKLGSPVLWGKLRDRVT